MQEGLTIRSYRANLSPMNYSMIIQRRDKIKKLTPWKIGPYINAVFVYGGEKRRGGSPEIVDTIHVNQGLFPREDVFVFDSKAILSDAKSCQTLVITKKPRALTR